MKDRADVRRDGLLNLRWRDLQAMATVLLTPSEVPFGLAQGRAMRRVDTSPVVPGLQALQSLPLVEPEHKTTEPS